MKKLTGRLPKLPVPSDEGIDSGKFFGTATPSSIRRVNRSIILYLIRQNEMISRASLSELTGIYRSNVSFIVEQLFEEGLVIERRATPQGRGRVPLLLSLNDDGHRVLAINVRPHYTMVAIAGLTGAISACVTLATPPDPPVLIRELITAVARLRKEAGLRQQEEIGHAAISVPGFVNSRTGQIRWLPTLPGYSDSDIGSPLEKAMGCPVVIDNDCNLGALAELHMSEADGDALRDFVFIEVGDEGVGAGIVMNREVYRGHDATLSAEVGHMIVHPDGLPCTCGRRGCWELYVCDRATWERYSPGVKFTHQRFQRFLASVQSGEPSAVAAIEETARYLSLGVSNVALLLNPSAIIIAGDICNLWNSISRIVESTFVSSVSVPIRTARLSADQLFLRGAIQLALSQIFSGPRLGR